MEVFKLVLGYVAPLILNLINYWVKNADKKSKLNKRFLDFIKSKDSELYDSLKMRKEFEDILEQIKEEDDSTRP